MSKIIIYGAAGLLIMASLILTITGPPGSHNPPKSEKARFQIEGFRTYVDADPYKSQLIQVPHLDNTTFVSITKLDPTVYPRNKKGEVLDPWGLPYVITRTNSQIIITSPGLDQYNKLSSFQKWLGSE